MKIQTMDKSTKFMDVDPGDVFSFIITPANDNYYMKLQPGCTEGYNCVLLNEGRLYTTEAEARVFVERNAKLVI